MDQIKNLFKEILANYPQDGKEKFGNESATWKRFILLKDALSASKPFQDNPDLRIQMSVGKGNWAEVPWVCFFPPNIPGPQQGVYAGILFRADMSGFYLFIGCGVSSLYAELGARAADLRLSEQVISYKNNLSEDIISKGFSKNEKMDLRASRNLGKRYEKGAIAFKFYNESGLQDDEIFLLDLQRCLNEFCERFLTGTTGLEDQVKANYWVASLESADFYNTNSADMKKYQPWTRHRIIKWGKEKDALFLSNVSIGDYVAILGYTGIHNNGNHYCSGRVINKDQDGYIVIELWDCELRGFVEFSKTGSGKKIFQVSEPQEIQNVFGEGNPP